MLDTPYFIDRAKRIYGYDHFIADSSGSFCEVIDLEDPNDPVLEAVASSSALLYIRGTEEDEEKLIARFKKAPKPMYYSPELLDQKWQQFKGENNLVHDHDVDPMPLWSGGFPHSCATVCPSISKLLISMVM